MLRILAVNAIALMTLGGGILYLNEFRSNLFEARLEQLTLQASTIAAALGESAVPGPEATAIDMAPAREIIRRLADPERVRARLFGTGGGLVADSRTLAGDRILYEEDLPDQFLAPPLDEQLASLVHGFLDRFVQRDPAPPFEESQGLRAEDLTELSAALEGTTAGMVRRRSDGRDVINVAVPVQRFRRVMGALLLTAETDDIEDIVRSEQLQIMRIFAAAFGLTVLLSFFLGRTLVRPIRILARAAERVRRGRGREEVIPEFAMRGDEIGDLSRSLSEMTRALYNQIDAVERFAADVAHEIKNPLTSMQSALETLERAEDPAIRARLLAVLKDDVRRMDRLITDISDASRLDAELTRGDKEVIDLAEELTRLVEGYNATHNGQDGAGGRTVVLEVSDEPCLVAGVARRLNQVWRNLIDNALSFSTDDGEVRIGLSRRERILVVTIDDDGPGLPEGPSSKIFKRFYSERPEHDGFGKHSGLGLAISKQIIEAHGGRITGENRHNGTEHSIGARFTVTLPSERPPQ